MKWVVGDVQVSAVATNMQVDKLHAREEDAMLDVW